jgi:phosphoglycolate phosphatase-like HAD superfamily hydrolase
LLLYSQIVFPESVQYTTICVAEQRPCAALAGMAAGALLRAIGLNARFRAVVTYGSTRLHKPHGDPVTAGLAGLGISPSGCVYLGDQPADIESGKAAGVETVAVLWGFGDEWELRAASPDRVLSEPTELISFIGQF